MPKLKATVKSLDSVPEELHSLYVQEGDEYILDVDGSDYKDKISEFRKNNIELSKKIKNSDALSADLKKLQDSMKAYEGIDPKVAKEAMEKVEKLKESKLIEEGKFEDLFQQRTDRMKRDYDAQIKALTDGIESATKSQKSLRSELTNHRLNGDLQRIVMDTAKPKHGAMTDILSRGRGVWSLNQETNQPEPRNSKGDIIYGKEANKPISMTEWVEGLVTDAPYLFEPSSGGGSGGSRHKVAGEREVSRHDQQALSNNLEGLATGKIRVVE